MNALLTALLLSANALAVPAQFTHQGRLVQPDGTPMTGEVSITFRVMNAETDGTPLWEEAINVSLNNGFYAAVLGANEVDNPLDVDVLKQAPVWLELQVGDEAAMSPRSAIQSVPYATIATEVVGGAVDASKISIDGSVVVDESGQWVGAAPTVNWADIEDVPPDAFTELGTSCVTGDIPVWNEFTAMWDCEMDQDTLASTSCSDGQILVYQMASGTWDCGTDTNTTLSAPEVQAMVEAMTSLALQSGTTVDGSAVLTESGHAADANAHHSSTSDGLHITPASVTLSDSDTQLVDGKIDLGSEGDDALTASMVQTLTGGGDANTLHTHAASSGGSQGRVEYLGVTGTIRAGNATLEVMDNDCAAAFGAARMCTYSQLKYSYPAPRPATQSWIIMENDSGDGSSFYTPEFGENFVSAGTGTEYWGRSSFQRYPPINCTDNGTEGLFVVNDDNDSANADYSVPAVTILPSGRMTRVSCSGAYTVACCGPK